MKQYLHEMQGRAIQDIWDDINVINSQSTERVGYSTQKPEKLLKRIIESSSDAGDIVVDFFMGSGTTQAVAHKM
ncbi:DNA methyltransferase, partial [Vibrio parahaemolyticus]